MANLFKKVCGNFDIIFMVSLVSSRITSRLLNKLNWAWKTTGLSGAISTCSAYMRMKWFGCSAEVTLLRLQCWDHYSATDLKKEHSCGQAMEPSFGWGCLHYKPRRRQHFKTRPHDKTFNNCQRVLTVKWSNEVWAMVVAQQLERWPASPPIWRLWVRILSDLYSFFLSNFPLFYHRVSLIRSL